MGNARQQARQTDLAIYIVNKIRTAQEVCGMSNAEISRRIQIPEKRVGRLLRMERTMKAEELVKFCCLFEISLKWLVSPELERELSTLRRKLAGDAEWPPARRRR